MKTTKITFIVLIAITVATIAGLACEVRSFSVNGTMINWSQFTPMFAILAISFSSISMKSKKEKKEVVAE